MKILISQLPQSPWWQNGVPLYDDNPAMRLGAIPNQSILKNISNYVLMMILVIIIIQ